MKTRPALLLPILLLTAPLFAQTRQNTPTPTPSRAGTAIPPPTDAEVTTLLKDFATDATRARATTRLLQIQSSSAIVQVYQALDDAHPGSAHEAALIDLLSKVQTRLRQQRSTVDSAINAKSAADDLAAYRQVGHHNAKWDAQVTRVLDRNAPARNPSRDLQEAIDLGCDDPLILVFAAEGIPNLSAKDRVSMMQTAIDHLETSAYSTAIKFYVEARFAKLRLESSTASLVAPDRVAAAAHNALKHVEDYAHTYPTSALLYDNTQNLVLVLKDVDPIETVIITDMPPIQKALANSATLDALMADLYMTYAWDARGTGFADTVTDEGWKRFDERLKQAQAYGTSGWKKDPNRSLAASRMIVICKGLGEPRPVMESWFRRATIPFPNNMQAYLDKMDYLLPKWNGSVPEVLEFGRQCLAKGNADDRLPTVLLEVHRNLGDLSGSRGAYMQQPEVWADIVAVQQKLLADPSRLKGPHRAQYLNDRGHYLNYCYDTHHFKEFLQLAAEFGDDVDPAPLGGPEALKEIKIIAAQHTANP